MPKDFAWTLTSALTVMGAGFVADKVVARGWKAVTGRPAPQDQDEILHYRLGEIVFFAVVSGAVISLTRELALRQAAAWYSRRSVGTLSASSAPALEA